MDSKEVDDTIFWYYYYYYLRISIVINCVTLCIIWLLFVNLLTP
jgi:hypothetical protein